MRVHVPQLLPANRQLVQPVAFDLADLLLDVWQLFEIFWQLLVLAEPSLLETRWLDLEDRSRVVRAATTLRFRKEAG